MTSYTSLLQPSIFQTFLEVQSFGLNTTYQDKNT